MEETNIHSRNLSEYYDNLEEGVKITHVVQDKNYYLIHVVLDDLGLFPYAARRYRGSFNLLGRLPCCVGGVCGGREQRLS